MCCKNVATAFFPFVTIHVFDKRTERDTDRQTNGQTDIVLSVMYVRKVTSLTSNLHHDVTLGYTLVVNQVI